MHIRHSSRAEHTLLASCKAMKDIAGTSSNLPSRLLLDIDGLGQILEIKSRKDPASKELTISKLCARGKWSQQGGKRICVHYSSRSVSNT